MRIFIICVSKVLLEECCLIKYSKIPANGASAIKEKWTSLHWLNSVERNRLPFVYHTTPKSKSHPVPQQILLANSSSVQRRIPNSEHFCLAFENVSVLHSGISLSQDPPSKLQHLTAPVCMGLLGQPDARPPYVTENKYLMIYSQTWDRTWDHYIRSLMLYQLSYPSLVGKQDIFCIFKSKTDILPTA